jgi:hypothetical protein
VALLISLFVAPEAVGRPPVVSQEPRTGAELVQEDEVLSGEEVAMVRGGGGALGGDVTPYRPKGPIHGQVNPDACVAASCRMMHSSVTGGSLAEAMWRSAARVDETGGRLSDATRALRLNGVPAELHEAMSVADLERATSQGPAIAAGRGRALVVDRIDGGLVYVRDPAPSGIGSSYAVSAERFASWWSGRAVVTG